MSSRFQVARETELTVHTRTRVTLHYCSLLFHCLISQRLINMHAFPGIGHDEESIPISNAGVTGML